MIMILWQLYYFKLGYDSLNDKSQKYIIINKLLLLIKIDYYKNKVIGYHNTN